MQSGIGGSAEKKLMKNKSRINVVLADYGKSDDNGFIKGLEESTGRKWKLLSWKNNGLRKNKFANIKRYIGYFWYPFTVFLKRSDYDKIIAWQQFYGIIFAFYCRLFHVKKKNDLTVMTFIYKDKARFAGKLYKSFVGGSVRSDYIDRIIVYSRSEVNRYARIFNVPREKFCYTPLGIEPLKFKGHTDKKPEKPFLLSVGRSNRDYGFLFGAAGDLPYHIVVLTDSLDKDLKAPENVTVYDDVTGGEYIAMLDECAAVLVPLKDPKISSGQLVILQAMQAGKPLVVTKARAVADYVTDGVNALVVEKDGKAFSEAAGRLMADEALKAKLVQNGKELFEEKFTVRSLGRRVGKMIG